MSRLITTVSLLLALVACGYSSPSGEVINHGRRWVQIKHDDGTVAKYETSRTVARRCVPGKRWPDCSATNG